MDPLSLTASITALLGTTARIIQYLNDVKGASKEKRSLALEAASLLGLLTDLKYRAEEAEQTHDPWYTSIRVLGGENGPLEQFRNSLEELAAKLNPSSGYRKAGRSLLWTFDKIDINNILARIERLKTLISVALSRDQIALTQAIRDDVSGVRESVLGVIDRVDQLQMNSEDRKRRKIIDWLSPLDFSKTQSDVFQRLQPGTGLWLLNSPEFLHWRDGTEKVLWCPGMPGAGKTILASLVVHHLRTNFVAANVTTTCIYCNYKTTSQTAINLVSSLLRQLVQSHPTISETVDQFYNSHELSHPTLYEIEEALRIEIRRCSKVFVVVDALDECVDDETRTALLTTLTDLPVNLFVTSRYSPAIEKKLDGVERFDVCAHDDDVRRYVEKRIFREDRLARHVKADPSLQDDIVNKVVDSTKGMFLLAQLHMDSLKSKSKRKEVRETLKRLPQELDVTYKEAMERIEAQCEDDRNLAKRVLSWIVYAFRPLSLQELRYALATMPGMTKVEDDDLDDLDILISVCAGLVIVDEESGIVRLVHYTAQKYFDDIRESSFPDAPANIATACLTYLSLDVFAEGHCLSYNIFENRLRENPFFDYAAQHWGDHICGNTDQGVQNLALDFLMDNSKASSSVQAFLISDNPQYAHDFPKESSGIHLAALFDLRDIMKLLLEKEADLNSKDNPYNRTPLSWVAEKGYEAVVRLLLAKDGVDPDPKGYYGRTPLSYAAGNGHEAVVRLLLANDGVDPDTKSYYGPTPLAWAAGNGHEAVVRLLLAKDGVDPDSNDIRGRTPLSHAAGNGHETVVGLLLAKAEVNPNSMDCDGQTPLAYAAWNGHEEVVGLLLAEDRSDPNAKSYDYEKTPLSHAAQNGCEAVVKLLLAKDEVDPDSKDSSGRTPLLYAAEKGHEAVVRLLVTKDGVDPDSKDGDGRTPLSWVAGHGHEAVVKLLLAKDEVDPDSKSRYQERTPLSWAAGNGHEAVVRLLLAKDEIDPDSKDNDGRTPLLYAARNGREAVAKLLLVKDGVNPDSKDSSGRTPLSHAAQNGREAVVKLLLTKDGVDPDSKDSRGRTPLSWAEIGHETVVELLLAKDGVDPNSRDSDRERTPLVWVAENKHEAVVKLLQSRES